MILNIDEILELAESNYAALEASVITPTFESDARIATVRLLASIAVSLDDIAKYLEVIAGVPK